MSYQKLKKYRKSQHTKAVDEIAKKTGYSKALINVVVASFFDGLRQLIKKNKDVKIKGLFHLILKPSYKKVLEKKGANYNLRMRKSK
jgi:nucleoid DNA-binding protein